MTQSFELFALQSTRTRAAIPHALEEPRPGDDIGRRLSLGEILSVELLGKLGCAQLNSAQFVRLSRVLVESFPDLRGIPVQPLKSLCQVANFAEELFWSCSANQWLRTKIISEIHPNDLFPVIETQSLKLRFSSIAFHSNFVPCHPDWRNPESGRVEGAEVARRRPCFPSHVLEDVPLGKKLLVERLNELEERNKESALVNSPAHDGGGHGEIKPLWKIGSHEYSIVDSTIVKAGKVWKISWRGGIFIMKIFKNLEVHDDDDDDESIGVNLGFDREIEVVRRLTHPHIVYSFGVSEDEEQKSLWMEAMDYDLSDLIEDEGRRIATDPPFSPLHTLDILLQIARAMTHMHGLPEPVIHGDLKPQNIFVLSHDEIEGEILGDVCQYYVKVADFGSARILKQNSSSFFNPDGGTTRYAAPEVLETRPPLKRYAQIEDPKKIDVYSFGILAFQILTGLTPYEECPSLLVAKEGVTELVPYNGVSHRGILKGVIAHNLRPPLREACGRPKFCNDLDLMALVESCWHRDAPARPAFSEVTSELLKIYKNLHQNLMNEHHPFQCPKRMRFTGEIRQQRYRDVEGLLRCACFSSGAVKE